MTRYILTYTATTSRGNFNRSEEIEAADQTEADAVGQARIEALRYKALLGGRRDQFSLIDVYSL